MTVLHATEAPSVFLSLFARVDRLEVGDVEKAFFVEWTVVRQLAMRRTLFVFPRDLLPAALGSASARTAAQERRALLKYVAASGITTDPDEWWTRTSELLLQHLAEGGPVTAAEVAGLDPRFEGRITVGTGRWTTEVPLGPRLLTLLGAEGRVVRAGNRGHWRQARPTWGVTEQVLGEPVTPLDSHDGYRELVRRWLATFGPGTEADIVWWLGATKTVVRRALAELDATQVSLDAGDVGWVLPDDVEPPADPDEEPWAALLPVLDPTTMGWKQRDFYLDPDDKAYLFDTNGNAGTTAWWNGRIVGCWVQDDDARVRVVLRPGRAEEIGPGGVAALDVESERLTDWLDGVVISSVYKSQQMKSATLP